MTARRPAGHRPNKTARRPAAAGYSGKPLPDKLGIKPGLRVAVQNAPQHYRELLGELPPGVELLSGQGGELDILHLFAADRRELEQAFPQAKPRIRSNGMLWVSWPKQSSALKSDLNENTVREIGLAHGLVDVKVAAIDQDWSGLKFVYRMKDR
jgi:hypothetical protein